MKTAKTFIFGIILIAALVFSSCYNPVALGQKLNLDPPVVTIESPDFLENVSGILVIKGKATDQQEIAYLNVTVENVGGEWKREFMAERGFWRSRNSSGQWEYQNDGVSWSGTSVVSWTITIPMVMLDEDGIEVPAPKGEYLISAGAENSVKTKGPIEQRRVVIDPDPPVVSVIMPQLYFEGGSYYGPYGVEVNFDRDFQRSSYNLQRIHNQKITLQYKIDDDFTINTLVFQLVDHTGGELHHEKNIDDLGWNGKFEIPGTHLPATREYMQVVSEATDKAGNKRIHSHGWLVWDPESDRPWVEGVGHESDPDSFRVYPGSEVQGQAYDDDGVFSVTYRLFKEHDTIKGTYVEILDPPELSHTVILENTPLEAGQNPSTFFSWGFIAPTATAKYMIRMTAEDINGLRGDTIERYFYVYDVDAPNGEITSPSTDITFFGSGSGTRGAVTISGSVDAGDAGMTAKLVWINPAAGINDRFLYQADEYSGWDSTGVDSNGHYRWNLTLTTAEWQPGVSRYKSTFTQAVNILSLLNKNDSKTPNVAFTEPYLSAQTFVLWVKQTSTGRAITKTYTFRGDVSPPTLDIRQIQVYSTTPTTTTKNYIVSGRNLTLNGAIKDKMDGLQVGDVITVSGRWSDDSYDHYGVTNLLGAFTVNWNDAVMTPVLATGNPLSWTATLNVTEAQATLPSARIEATLKDIGNNSAFANFNANIETNIPYLITVSSLKDDGIFGPGENIIISLEFNMPVQFSSGTATLTTNTGGTASYLGGSAAQNPTTFSTSGRFTKHYFTYTVGAGQNTASLDPPRLDVTAVNNGGGSWLTENAASAITTIPAQRLNYMKNIRIDTTAPAAIRTESLSGAKPPAVNYYHDGAILYVLVTFNEDIQLDTAMTAPVINFEGSGITGTRPQLSGNRGIMFEYAVGSSDDHNTAQLNAVSISNPQAIKDLAGNSLASATYTLPTTNAQIVNNTSNPKNIIINNTPPDAPTIRNNANNTPAAGGTYGSYEFNILPAADKNSTPLDRVEYRLTASGTVGQWLPYTLGSGIELLSPGTTYGIEARSYDKAGNMSSAASVTGIYIKPTEALLQSLGGTAPGTYGLSQGAITIELNLREDVTIANLTSVYLELNVPRAGGTWARANLVSGHANPSNKLTFSYEITAGDNVTGLNIRRIVFGSTTLTADGEDVTDEIPADANSWSSQNFNFYRTINIDTNPLNFVSTTLTATELTITFSKNVYKGSGNIEIAMEPTSNYRAPAVMSRAEYLRYGGDSVLGTYYTSGTNGAIQNGTNYSPDTSQKYVLNWNIEPNNPTLTGILIDKNAHKVTVPVVTSQVTGGTGTTTTIIVPLTEASGNALPVKGVPYKITFSNNLARDSMNNTISDSSLTANATQLTKTNPGVNKPVIRVNKAQPTYNVISGLSTTGTYTELPAGEQYWVRNTNISLGTPGSPGTWARVENFSIDFGDTYTNLLYSNANSSAFSNYRISMKELYANDDGAINGEVRANPARTQYSIGWVWMQNYVTIHGQGGTNFTGQGNQEDVYVNPFDAHANYGTSTDWLNGRIRFMNVYVRVDNLTTVTGNSTAASVRTAEGAARPGAGWLKVVGTQAPGASGLYSAVAVQPLTSQYRIDCQTPGVTLTYRQGIVTSAVNTGRFNVTTAPNYNSAMPTDGGNQAYTAGTLNDIGSTSTTDRAGYLYGIRAVATLAGATETSYEFAARSVIQYTNFNATNNVTTLRTSGNGRGEILQLWLRGGDNPSGTNSTAGFPLSWNETDYTGARLLTNEVTPTPPTLAGVSGTGTWYWVTWNVTAPAYFHFIAGTTAMLTSEALARSDVQLGPKSWTWGKNRWAFQYDKFMLHPGLSLSFSTTTDVEGMATERFEFYEAFSGRRTTGP